MTILSLLHPSITWEKYFILSKVAKEIFKKVNISRNYKSLQKKSNYAKDLQALKISSK